MAEEGAFHSWLCEALSQLKLTDEVYVGYVESILKDDTYQLDEKQGAVLELLASSTEEDLTAFSTELMARWHKIEETKSIEQEEKKRREAEQLKEAQRQQQRAREDKQAKQRVEQQLSKEERLKRRELLERYGYQVETTDENGDIILTENVCDTDDSGVEHNDNVSKIVQESQAQREMAREKHQLKVQREKELLLKDQERKEKRKRKTEKREKRRL